MADEELEAGEGGKKSPILTYILIGVGVIVALAITIVATMYFVGYFDPGLCRADRSDCAAARNGR